MVTVGDGLPSSGLSLGSSELTSTSAVPTVLPTLRRRLASPIVDLKA